MQSRHVAALQGVSFFGGSDLRQSQVEELANAELLAGNDRMVVLSDVWLDSPEVMDQLQTLFTGLQQCCFPVLAQEWCEPPLVDPANSTYGVHRGPLLPEEATLAAAPVLRSAL